MTEGRIMQAEWEHAAGEGDVEALERLLANGADINARDTHGQTALMISARNGHDRAVALLVERGADVNHTAKFHLSALMLAVLNNHAGIVSTLVMAGADRSIRGTGAPGFSGQTAMDLAEAAGRHEVVDLLRAADQPPGGES
ncbi:MAG: ankyrin repeat domain-containing protein [Vicinamibacterales bacterium]